MIYVVVVVYPMAYSAYLSFFKWDGVSPTKQFVGLQNYLTLLLNDPVFWIALRNNAIWLVASLLLPTSIGLGLAVLLNQKFRSSHIFRSVFYFPAILSLAIVGLIWNWIYLPDIGLINQILGALGLTALQHNWLSDPNFALYAVMLAATWNATGLPMLLFLAGLQTINPEVLEAAQGRWSWTGAPILFHYLSALARNDSYCPSDHGDQLAEGVRYYLCHDLRRTCQSDSGS